MKDARTLIWPFLILILLLVVGCSGEEVPTGPPTPTPEIRFLPLELQMAPTATGPAPYATPLPVELRAISEREPVVDPVSNLLPVIDPQILALLQEVSEQNLMAYVQRLEDFGTRNTFSDTESDDFGIGAARRWIFSEFQRVGGERLDVQFQDYTLNFEGRTTTQIFPGRMRRGMPRHQGQRRSPLQKMPHPERRPSHRHDSAPPPTTQFHG